MAVFNCKDREGNGHTHTSVHDVCRTVGVHMFLHVLSLACVPLSCMALEIDLIETVRG